MGNKYTWVFFNLVASIGSIAFLLMLNPPKHISASGWQLFLLLLLAAGFWLFRTIIYWRKCVQADDPKFDEIVRRTSNKPDDKAEP